MTSAVIADDQELIRAGFRLILGAAQPPIDVIGEARSGHEAVELARELRPDVILMDIRMPGLDGIEATRHITRLGVDCRVLMLTTFDVDEYVYEAFRAGASGFLLKNSPSEQLVSGIEAVAAGDALLSPTLTRRLIERYIEQPAPGSDSRLKMLSDRETQVLMLIAAGLSNQEIAETLFVSPGTVKTHVTRILTKLGLRDRVQAVVLAYETGLVQAGKSRPTG
ncbi:MAG: response regulator [Acidothermaceae bacterium]